MTISSPWQALRFHQSLRVLIGLALLAVAFQTALPQTAAPEREVLPLLTNLYQVRKLSAEQAARGYPVQVTVVLGGTRSIRFIHDGTGSCYIPSDGLSNLVTGTRLSIQGVTVPGDFAPFVNSPPGASNNTPMFTVTGTGELPPPLKLTGENLLMPDNDCQRVELSGIVRTLTEMKMDGDFTSLIELRIGAIPVTVYHRGTQRLPPGLVPGALVIATGNLGSKYNSSRQVIAGAFLYAEGADLKMESAGPTQAFALPVNLTASLGRYSNKTEPPIFHIKGQITAVRPGTGFFVQDSSGSMWIDHSSTEAIQPGDLVDVAGFPSIRRLVTSLDDVQIRAGGKASLPAAQEFKEGLPRLVDYHNESTKELDGKSLRFHAVVTQVAESPTAYLMVLGTGSSFLTAELAKRPKAPAPKFPEVGSTVEISGVYHLEVDNIHNVSGAKILLRTVSDIRLIAEPTGMTPRRVRKFVWLSSCVVALLLGWGWILHGKKNQLQKKLEEKRANEAKLIQNQLELERLVSERTAEVVQHEQFISHVVELVPGLLFLKDHAGRFLLVNKAMADYLGDQASNLIGKTDEETVGETGRPKRIQADELEVLSGGKQQAISEEFWTSRQGQSGWYHIIRRNMSGPDGKPALVGLAIDITERKEAEEKRAAFSARQEKFDRMESVGRLAGGIAHDFNNMLGVIIAYTEIAMSQVDASHPIHSDLLEIERAARHSAELTQQLLAYARRQPVEPKVLDVNKAVNNLLKLAPRLIGENIHVTPVAGPKLWPIKMDPTQMDQILLNLMVNARDAISGVGEMGIETGNCQIDEEFCSTQPEAVAGEYVRVIIRDNGRGMEKETLAHIFEPFFTTKEVGKGTGLGLATVFGAVRQNGGFITVSSQPGHGTQFSIFLPRWIMAAPEPEILAQPTAPAAAPLQGAETILLVEDEPSLLKMVAKVLKGRGYLVLACGSPGEAIRVAGENANKIRLLLTDVIMPEMNGRELAEKLTARHPDLKCLFMSGYTADVIADQGVVQAEFNFIQKPFTNQDLAAKVREVLDSPGQ